MFFGGKYVGREVVVKWYTITHTPTHIHRTYAYTLKVSTILKNRRNYGDVCFIFEPLEVASLKSEHEIRFKLN